MMRKEESRDAKEGKIDSEISTYTKDVKERVRMNVDVRFSGVSTVKYVMRRGYG